MKRLGGTGTLQRIWKICIAILIGVVLFFGLDPRLSSFFSSDAFHKVTGSYTTTTSNEKSSSTGGSYGNPIQNPPVTVTVLDIGQGDAHLIRVGDEYSLIDTGDVEHRPNLVAMLQKMGVTKLKRVIITHPHSDHMGGFLAVANAFPIETVYDGGFTNTTSVYKSFVKVIKQKKIAHSQLQAGDSIDFGDNVSFTVYAPWKEPVNSKENKIDYNNNSIVGKLVYGKFSMMFTGDAERIEENLLIKEQNTKMFSRILKVGHHGSNTSTQKDFIRSIRPEVAVISVGLHNDYQHPSRDVLQRLKNENVTIFRTDEDGSIMIDTDGSSWYVHSER